MMSAKQKFLRTLYPVLRFFSGLFNMNTRIIKGTGTPATSFYALNAVTSGGENFSFESIRGKKILLVNTASECGYTAQLGQLTELKKRLPHLEILAFPSNDFRNQEPGDDEAVSTFCSIQYGINYRLFKKCVVKKLSGQHPVYQWLSNAGQNGWNNRAPEWNFSKYVIDETGRLTHYIEHAVDPLDVRLIRIFS
jgi:glutathione peroxidase